MTARQSTERQRRSAIKLRNSRILGEDMVRIRDSKTSAFPIRDWERARVVDASFLNLMAVGQRPRSLRQGGSGLKARSNSLTSNAHGQSGGAPPHSKALRAGSDGRFRMVPAIHALATILVFLMLASFALAGSEKAKAKKKGTPDLLAGRPYLTAIYPAGGQRGKTIEVVVSGTNLATELPEATGTTVATPKATGANAGASPAYAPPTDKPTPSPSASPTATGTQVPPSQPCTCCTAPPAGQSCKCPAAKPNPTSPIVPQTTGTKVVSIRPISPIRPIRPIGPIPSPVAKPKSTAPASAPPSET